MKPPGVSEQLGTLPTKPGVYLLKDEKGDILYVGKAAILRQRVRAYFGSPETLPPNLQKMASRVRDIDFIVTDSEQEALILECNLIKKHRPHYNVRLKDDKSYPYLKIKVTEDWPRVYITRQFEGDGSRYFGPFASAGSLRQTLGLLKKLFPYRSCSKAISGTDSRPCLDYYIHRCLAPCIGAVTKEEYQGVIRQVILFLEGRQEQVVRELQRRMTEAAEKLEFERAGLFRDQLRAVERVIEHQKIVSTTGGDEDVIAFAREKDEACVQVFFIRGGKLIGREHFILEGTQDEGPGQIMTSFLKQFYGSAPYVPPQILLQDQSDDMEVIGAWLESKRGGEVSLRVPRRGEKKKLVNMVAENARQILGQLKAKRLSDRGKTAAALAELEEQLELPRLPRCIECYDISDIRGTAAVGSMVVFEGGKPKSARYRRFRIKTIAGANDCAMIQEVLHRRFRRGGEAAQNAAEGSSWALTPDLVLIDGGRGQLNAALDVMRELEVDAPVAALAKENEEIFLPEMAEPLSLSRHSQALYLLQQIRDEAHRFALAYHLKVRQKSALTSGLDAVPGIGPKRKRALIRRFGSIKGVKEASVDELAAVAGMTRSLAEKVKEYL